MKPVSREGLLKVQTDDDSKVRSQVSGNPSGQPNRPAVWPNRIETGIKLTLKISTMKPAQLV